MTWSLGTLAAGGSGSVTVTVDVNSPIADGTVLHNSSSIDSTETAPVSAQVDVPVTSLPVLILDKIASKSTASAGDQLVYTLNFQNTGSDQATNVVLEDHLPTDVTFNSASGGATESAGVVTWNLGALAAGGSGSVTVTVDVNSTISNGTVLHNSSSINSVETAPVSAQVDVTVTSLPVLTLNKTSSKATVNAGGQLVYTLDFQNTGSDQATNVVLEDHLPTDVTFNSASGGATESAGVVTWNLGALAAGGSGSVTVTVDVNSTISNGTVLHNSSTINSTETAPVSAQVDVTVTSLPVLNIDKTASKTHVDAGEELLYTLNYQNTGSTQATNVVLEDHLPGETVFKSASGGGTETGGVVKWNLGTLAAGQSGSVTVTVVVNSHLLNGTVLHNTAAINSTETPPVSSTVVDTMVTSLPILTLDKTASANPVDAGAQLVYTLQYANIGSSPANNVVLTDELPPGTTLVNSSPVGTVSGNKISWNLGILNPGDSGETRITVTVDQALSDGTILTNTAGIDSPDTNHVSAVQSVNVRSTAVQQEAKPVPTIGFLATILLSLLLFAFGGYGLKRHW